MFVDIYENNNSYIFFRIQFLKTNLNVFRSSYDIIYHFLLFVFLRFIVFNLYDVFCFGDEELFLFNEIILLEDEVTLLILVAGL